MKSTAQLFKALSDETRLRILALLSAGELCVCDLMAILDLPQSTVSRHLAYLRNSSLVVDRREGVWMYYRLEAQTEALQVELLDLLGRRLPEQQRAAVDRAALEKRLSCGKAIRC
jgi:ArsR family transcriptional regulator, arsenate/arsenite/antimonite-responsive transcriptional repressor